ncbi:MAG TPA: hypothetical protein VEX70_00945 [Pyrinomonadaceae bacterium]|nr:hypothetical protein [Pyrinomonadaceae bacterium]
MAAARAMVSEALDPALIERIIAGIDNELARVKAKGRVPLFY